MSKLYLGDELIGSLEASDVIYSGTTSVKSKIDSLNTNITKNTTNISTITSTLNSNTSNISSLTSEIDKIKQTHQPTAFYNLTTLGLTDDGFSTTDFFANIKMITDAADTIGSCEQLTFEKPFGTSSNMTKSILAKMQTDLGYQFDCYIDLVIRKYNTATAHVYIYTQGITSYVGYALYCRVRFDDSSVTTFVLHHHPDGFCTPDHIHNRLYHSDGVGYVLMGFGDNSYYLRPPADMNVYCGSSSYPWYKIYTNRLEVLTERIKCLPTYENTVDYVTNMYIGSTGVISRTTKTSSKTIKHDIKLLENEDLQAENLYNINVYQFKYNDGIITDESSSRYGKDLVGFIIEDLNEKYPIAVDKPSENVKEWSWNSHYLIPPMLKLIQDQKKEIDELREEIELIKNK